MKTVTKAFPAIVGIILAISQGFCAENSGEEILRNLIEANRYWLLGPPETAANYRYDFHLLNSDPRRFTIQEPSRAPHSQRQGISYYSVLQHAARRPDQVTVRDVSESNGLVRLSLRFDPILKVHIGNGVESSWRGYFSMGTEQAEVTVRADHMIPVRLTFGNVQESFSDFVQVDAGHFVPLGIQVEKEDGMRFDWKFRLYQEGLWLFDFAEYREQKAAWIDNVAVNSQPAQIENASAASLAREQSESKGAAAVQTVLNANRHWLLPSLERRRNFAYEYLQEHPYRELVLFDGRGNVMVELSASKQSPDQPTRQWLWTKPGEKIQANQSEAFVAISKIPSVPANSDLGLVRDRNVQNLAWGLGIDCAITRLAREPDSFSAEVRTVEGAPDRYVLILRARKDARLFSGTMLMFTSTAYLHDVRFNRSEILCDSATHRILEEKDFSGDELKAQYWFENYLDDEFGAAPGEIRALMPSEKNKQDQSLEMLARFRFAQPGIWLLERVESSFHGGGGGSVGVVNLIAANETSFEPMRQLLGRRQRTEEVLKLVQSASKGSQEAELVFGEWKSFALQPAWTEAAERALGESDEDARRQPPGVIGLYRARASETAEGKIGVEFEGITTASWKEFETQWTLTMRGQKALEIASVQVVRCENTPGAFSIRFELPEEAIQDGELKFSLRGSVERLSGMYHGHGMWMTLARPSRGGR